MVNLLVVGIQLLLLAVGCVGTILASYVLGGIPYLSGFIGELYGTIGLKTLGPSTVHLTEDGEYEFRAANPGETAPELWTRLAGTAFAVSYEATERAFGNAVYDSSAQGFDPAEAETADGPTPQTMEIPIEREGVKTFAEADPGHGWRGIVIKAAEYFEKFVDTAGLDIVSEAESAELEDSGGDTGQHPAKVKLIGMIIFFLLGLPLGWVWFL